MPQPLAQPQPYQPQPYQPSYQAQPYQQPWQQPPAAEKRVMGQPVHVLLIVAAVVAVVALLLPWYSTQTSSRVSWNTTGYEYSDGTRSTWSLPSVSTSSYGGGNGLSVFTLALAAAIGGLALRYRSGQWPRWAAFTLAGVAGLVTFIGLINTLYDANIGPLLYGAAGALAIPGTLKILTARS